MTLVIVWGNSQCLLLQVIVQDQLRQVMFSQLTEDSKNISQMSTSAWVYRVKMAERASIESMVSLATVCQDSPEHCVKQVLLCRYHVHFDFIIIELFDHGVIWLCCVKEPWMIVSCCVTEILWSDCWLVKSNQQITIGMNESWNLICPAGVTGNHVTLIGYTWTVARSWL